MTAWLILRGLQRVGLLLLVCWVVGATPARAQGAGLCRAALALTERASGVPDRLMQAIAVIESGRRDGAGRVAGWPWTINVEGVGEVFDTKQDAIRAVQAHQARGARSIDVGCMQVNLMHHADAFSSLEDAFDPVVNARYAARFLQQLLAQTGSWPRAVAGYHSLTPDIGAEYARKVLAAWAVPEGAAEAARLDLRLWPWRRPLHSRRQRSRPERACMAQPSALLCQGQDAGFNPIVRRRPSSRRLARSADPGWGAGGR